MIPRVNKPENTAIHRKRPSLPLKEVIECGWLKPGARVLDYGCGFGDDVGWFKRHGYRAVGYDPRQTGWTTRPTGLFDMVMVIYVVNVLDEPDERRDVIEDAWSYLKPGGFMIIAARTRETINREARQKSWPRHSDGYWSSLTRCTFQKGHTLRDMESLIAGLDDADSPLDWSHGDCTGVFIAKFP